MTMISKRDKLSERWTLVLSFVLETKEDKRQGKHAKLWVTALCTLRT